MYGFKRDELMIAGLSVITVGIVLTPTFGIWIWLTLGFAAWLTWVCLEESRIWLHEES